MNPTRDKWQAILRRALDALHRTTGIAGQVTEREPMVAQGFHADARVEVEVNGQRYPYLVQIKRVDRFAILGRYQASVRPVWRSTASGGTPRHRRSRRKMPRTRPAVHRHSRQCLSAGSRTACSGERTATRCRRRLATGRARGQTGRYRNQLARLFCPAMPTTPAQCTLPRYQSGRRCRARRDWMGILRPEWQGLHHRRYR